MQEPAETANCEQILSGQKSAHRIYAPCIMHSHTPLSPEPERREPNHRYLHCGRTQSHTHTHTTHTYTADLHAMIVSSQLRVYSVAVATHTKLRRKKINRKPQRFLVVRFDVVYIIPGLNSASAKFNCNCTFDSCLMRHSGFVIWKHFFFVLQVELLHFIFTLSFLFII